MKKDEVYVLNQPKHLILSIIVVDTKFPLSQKTHENLSKLLEISDIGLVFSDKYFPEQLKIDKRKFSSLYQSCFFIDSEYNVGLTVMKSLLYGRAIFDNHIGYTISMLSDLENLVPDDLDKLLKITGSSIAKPVFKIRRLDTNEFFEIYNKDDKKEKSPTKISLYRKILERLRGNELQNDERRMYSIWHSNSKFMHFKSSVVGLICEEYCLNDKNLEVINTFDEADPRYLFSSLIKMMGIDILNLDLKDVSL